MTNVIMTEVTSSNILSIGYDDEVKSLYVKFKSGKVYEYENVPASVYDELSEAESVGKYFNQMIKNNYVTRIVP
jgi:hypothetical protein